jgi:small-conductance mechanosensitive channel
MMKSYFIKVFLLLALMSFQKGPVAQASLGKPRPPADEPEASTAIAKAAEKTLLEKSPYLLGATLFSFIMDPIVEKLFNSTHLKHEKGRYKQTLFYATAKSIDLGAKAYGATLSVDFVQTLIPKLKQRLPFTTTNLFQAAPHVGLLIWGSKALSCVKHLMLSKLVHGTRMGKVAFVDRILDLTIGISTAYNVLHVLGIELGMGLNSLFAASGVSAIIFSLASKGMVEQIVGGLLLNGWDAIEVGEYVRFQDGTEGTVVSIGLIETELMGSDHVPMRVPNSQIVGKRISMYSKVTQSQVKQTLRFKYQDLDKLPTILQDIEQEIKSVCDDDDDDDDNDHKLTSASARLTTYEADHIQVSVICNFDMKPGTSEYAEIREKVLFAIADAVIKNNVEFALPAIQYETSGSQPLVGR